MPTVKLTDRAELGTKNLAGVLITKDTPVEFPSTVCNIYARTP